MLTKSTIEAILKTGQCNTYIAVLHRINIIRYYLHTSTLIDAKGSVLAARNIERPQPFPCSSARIHQCGANDRATSFLVSSASPHTDCEAPGAPDPFHRVA